MQCPKCGLPLQSNQRFCTRCGAALAFPVRKKKHAVWPWLLGILAAAAVLTVAGIFFWSKYQENRPEERYQRQLLTAGRYVEEADYDAAMEAFEAAIDMDPARADAYISLADLYVIKGSYERAKRVMDRAERYVKSQEGQDEVQEAREALEEAESADAPAGQDVSEDRSESEDAAATASVSDTATENEVSLIREKYNRITDSILNDQLSVTALDDGVTVYKEDDAVLAIIAIAGWRGDPYSRQYYFDEGKLFFAYFEETDAHRLYFKDGRLIRWRYTPDASVPENAVNHDMDGAEGYAELEAAALAECDSLLRTASGSESSTAEEEAEPPAASGAPMSADAVESEVASIREVYNRITDDILNDRLEVETYDGVSMYLKDGVMVARFLDRGYNGYDYGRYYYYDNGHLIFAYFEGNDAHRLYFKDDRMIRWRYSPNAAAPQDAVNHDMDGAAGYDDIEDRALYEAYGLFDI